MQVVIPKSSLVKYGACDAYLKSPEWDQDKEALVYSEWNATVQRLLSDKWGTTYLDWLVSHKLVPMTAAEFTEARSELMAVAEAKASGVENKPAEAKSQKTMAARMIERLGHG